MLNNVFVIILIILIAGIIVYFYYQHTNNIHKSSDNYENKNNIKIKKKKNVRFNNNVKYIDEKNNLEKFRRNNNKNKVKKYPFNQNITNKTNDLPNWQDINGFNDAETIWDSSFGQPLIKESEKKKFAEKIKRNHKKFEKALGCFTEYQTDNNVIVKTDITIDPFKSKGRYIKDIYDDSIKQLIPKSKRSSNMIEPNDPMAHDESIMGNSYYKSASFGDEF